MYGLLAEEMLVAPDKSSITFRLNPKARFNNGDPVTAEDVKHSFDMLTSKHAAPAAARAFAGGSARRCSTTARSASTSRTAPTTRSSTSARACRCSRASGALGPDGKPKALRPDRQRVPDHQRPVHHRASPTPDAGSISSRNPDYWARDLGVRRGQFNFDRVVYRYYQDGAISMEAFKAGEFDLLQEYSARRWARVHAGPSGATAASSSSVPERLRRRAAVVPVQPAAAAVPGSARARGAGLHLRLRGGQRLQAVQAHLQHVRELRVRRDGPARPGELALLEPFRAQLPPEVFGPAWEPPRNDSPIALRENLLKARALLEEAGWKLAADGVLRNAKGEPFEFEYLEDIGGAGRAAVAGSAISTSSASR